MGRKAYKNIRSWYILRPDRDFRPNVGTDVSPNQPKTEVIAHTTADSTMMMAAAQQKRRATGPSSTIIPRSYPAGRGYGERSGVRVFAPLHRRSQNYAELHRLAAETSRATGVSYRKNQTPLTGVELVHRLSGFRRNRTENFAARASVNSEFVILTPCCFGSNFAAHDTFPEILELVRPCRFGMDGRVTKPAPERGRLARLFGQRKKARNRTGRGRGTYFQRDSPKGESPAEGLQNGREHPSAHQRLRTGSVCRMCIQLRRHSPV